MKLAYHASFGASTCTALRCERSTVMLKEAEDAWGRMGSIVVKDNSEDEREEWCCRCGFLIGMAGLELKEKAR